MFHVFLVGLIFIASVFFLLHAIKALICVVIFGGLITLLWYLVAPRTTRLPDRWWR